MKVAFINLSIEPYPPVEAQAISTCIQQTARALRAGGHDVMIFSRLSKQPVEESGVYGIPNVPTDLPPLVQKAHYLRGRFRGLDWPGQSQYLRDVRRSLPLPHEAPDVSVVANDFHAPGMLRCVYPGRKVLLWLHNEQLTNHHHSEAAFGAVDRVVTVSAYLGDWAQRTFHLADEHIAVAHNGVNTDQFHPRPDFTVPVDCPRVLFVGRIDEGKSPDVLLSSLAGLARQGTHGTVTLVGGFQRFRGQGVGASAYVEEVMCALNELGGSYLGPVARSGLPAIMREHDIVCVPSRVNEAFSLVTLEAMASGCAVVASDRGGLPEACGDAAIQVNPENQGAMEEAMGSLLRDEALLRSYKEKAVQHAHRKNWTATADGLLAAASLRQ